jgi:predicted enzyme related to lactoylglutathione lyase
MKKNGGLKSMTKNSNEIGNIIWADLTVNDAPSIRDFYSKVVGWKFDAVGDHGFNMYPPKGDKEITGICHARGENADLPAQWLLYIVVENLDESIQSCLELGGKIIKEPINAGESKFCVIQDPAGAYMALYSYE